MFGTEEQKQRFLPRVAAGEVSAFLLTEPDVGSDPARLAHVGDARRRRPTCSTASSCGPPTARSPSLFVVMARVPATEGDRGGITAFVVEADSPGITVETPQRVHGAARHRERASPGSTTSACRPRTCSVGVGRGLKIALTTLNTGRLSLPAMCVAAAKWCLNVARGWSAERVQWGRRVGDHEAVATKIAFIAATTYALESMLDLSCMLADDETNDIRIEAALVKLYASEMAWKIADELIQIRGGRGYETADVAARRAGERPAEVEQILRDMRINRIFEGSTEIMHLLIAREAVDAHLDVAGDIIDPDASTRAKAEAVGQGGRVLRRLAADAGGRRRARARRVRRVRPAGRAPALRRAVVPAAGARPSSTGWPAGRARWSAGRRSWAAWSTSAPSCSR